MDAPYSQAIGHSRRVRRLRIALPALALVLSAGFAMVSIVRTYLPENIKIEGINIEDGKVVMAKPAIAGLNSNGAPYSMNASRALQDIKNPNMITLESITAQMPVSDNASADITAASGTYNRASDTMTLTKPFRIHLSNGVDAMFQSGDLDVKAGKLKTDEMVTIIMKASSLVAQSMDMTDKGRNITFKGKIRLSIDPATLKNPGN
ncbi:lipopolysaccharide export system protein LptC [Agrobacterium vitis]|nr:lipopolysaccharide export system protein LptC [Agrobacterium vitis]MBE1437351.1 lipopolysaccharide export system protein LptC [Agrobacterium vitis]